MSWLALVLVGIVEAAVLSGNLLVHQTLTLTRTPSQTLNLLYVTLVATSACTYLVLTRSARPAAGDVPNELRALAGRLVWHSFKRGAQFSALFGVVFVAGALVFSKTIIEGSTFQVFFLAGDFIVLGAVYVIGGAVCGAAVGGIRAAHERVDEIVRSFHSLAEPLIRALVQSAGAELGKSSQSQLAAASERARGLLARLVQWRFIRVMRGHWVLELLHDYAAHPAAHPSQSLEQVLGERLIRGTADDIRARLRLTQWVTLAIAALIWWAPALLILLRQSPSSR
jgi:hypothetical protein